MIELERHIEILLLSNDCVIVPDFGGFMAHHGDARFDERDNMFIPPLRTIGFNPKLKMNDSLLAQSYVEAYDISYPEALKRIADEVREIKQRIESEGTFELHNIGVITLNDDGHYEFEPCEAGILTPELYGLGCFELKPLSLTQIETETTPESAKAENISINNSEEVFEDEDSERTISIKVSLLRNLAAACIAIIVFFLLPTPLNNSVTNTAGRGIDTRLLNKIMPKEITIGTASLKNIDIKNSNSTNTNTDTKNTKTQEVKATADKDCFVIVLAAKVAKTNAEVFVESLKKQGLSEARVITRNNSSKVVYGNYTTKQDAYKSLNELKDNTIFAEGWIMQLN